ncbi:tetratricopeptide repeat protein [Kibdelosporangium aridum]|uniref:Tetratricopeptide repeat-containing protein n=1 Tax=Kibdelosporangium aridum TaxID=2030 RepID=A0A1W2FLA5_KIBAR|nr:tetratricopeptide repeat protein [Kibdelosporangium aridum]SMD22643.1 Tetratricopeptide repeat-containing protein [Kibdelosporangium aridum]
MADSHEKKATARPAEARRLGELLRDKHRRSRLVTQVALAAAAQVSDRVVSDLFTAARPVPLPTVLGIARKLGDAPEWLQEVEEQWHRANRAWRGDLPAPEISGTRRRRFGAVPPRAGAFQRRAVSEVLTRVTVLTGLGGVGKTQVAADHAHAQWDGEKIDLLMWISARTRAAVVDGFAEVAQDLLGHDPADGGKACDRLLAWLAETAKRWLVVLDDLQSPAVLNGLWPPYSATGQVVITTRCRDAALQGHRRRIVDVELFTDAEALTYLIEKLPARAGSGSTELAGLAKELGNLPLALAQAAAYLINKPLLSCAGYRAKLADRRITLRELLPREEELPDEYAQSVAATWSLSIDAADELDPLGVARPIMELASLLDPAGIPTAVFATEAVANYLDNRLDREITAEDATSGLECLQRFSLLTLDLDEPQRAVRVHALVQRAVRECLAGQRLDTTILTVADALFEVWPEIQTVQAALRANANALWKCTGPRIWQLGVHPILIRAARSLVDAGLLSQAVTYCEDIARHATTELGSDHRDTFAIRLDLARSRAAAGDLRGATAELRELLARCLQVIGYLDPATFVIRANLAQCLGEAGDPATATEIFDEVLTGQVALLGADHPDTLGTRGNRAVYLAQAGHYDAALDELKVLHRDHERVLGPDHPSTLLCRSNLARQLAAVGYDLDARIEQELVLQDRIRVLGPDHPSTLITRQDIANSKINAFQDADAKADLEELLKDQQRILGSDHPHTFGTRLNLVMCRLELDDRPVVSAELERLLLDTQRVLGNDHPLTDRVRFHLQNVRRGLGASSRSVP